MRFEEMQYIRPDYDVVSQKYTDLINDLEKADNSKEFLKIFNEINEIKVEITTMMTLCQIRHTINTADEFYDTENNYWDEISPKYTSLAIKVDKIALSKPYREELLKEIPETYFKMAEFSIKTFSDEVLEDLQEENKLTSEYAKLKASAKLEFEGETLNLSQFSIKFQDKNRDIRKKAYETYFNFYKEHDKEFSSIYDKLVKVRTKIARKLGYKNFIELGYYRMNRLDYNEEMVSDYRKQILEDIVPIVKEFKKDQAKRIGLDELKYYDLNFKYLTGNPTPKGTYEYQVDSARKMYHEMSDETKEFIDVIVDNGLWDLKSKENKAMGGYCTSINKYKVPFIFANFNGTSHDVDVLTHEAGHAFQVYMSRNIPVIECVWPTYESCEIHSMSMEFFAYPWLESFFKEDINKYYHDHLIGTLSFLPYGVLVDHFQHEVYRNPDMSMEERKACYRKLEKQYLPYNDYSENEFLQEGVWWYQQGHIFESPFYYIDYTLAQICALQFFKKSKENFKEAWKDYIHLCKLGGTMSFVSLVKEAKLISPFEDGCVKSIIGFINDYIKNIDTSKF